MAVDVLSIQVRDGDGDTKSLTFYVPSGSSLVQLQLGISTLMSMLDPCIGGVIVGGQINFNVPAAPGLKTDPVVGAEVQRGALLSYLPADTVYRHSIFVPSWLTEGFSGDTVVYTGDFQTLIDAFVGIIGSFPGIQASDANGNDLIQYIEGVKKFRK